MRRRSRGEGAGHRPRHAHGQPTTGRRIAFWAGRGGSGHIRPTASSWTCPYMSVRIRSVRLPGRRVNEVGCRSANPFDDAHGQIHVGGKLRRPKPSEPVGSAAKVCRQVGPGQALLASLLVHGRVEESQAPAQTAIRPSGRKREAPVVSGGALQKAFGSPSEPSQHEERVLTTGPGVLGEVRRVAGLIG
jgi:hypothetical protein